VRPGSEAEAYALLEQLRWGGEPRTCPHCAATGHFYYLRPADGISRPTRTGASTQRRVWKCATCRRQFSVLTGTVFEGTRIGLRAWIAVIDDWARATSPPDVADIATRYGLSGEAARQLRRRVAAGVDELRAAPAGGQLPGASQD
jgi:transposase-like protein